MVVLPDVSHQDLHHVVQYAYNGVTNVPYSSLQSFMVTAESLQITGVNVDNLESPDARDESMPQDLSMKPSKKLKLDESLSLCPSPAHDSKPESFLRKTLLTFPAQSLQSLSSSVSTSTSSMPHKVKQSNAVDKHSQNSSKLPNWSQSQLQDAIESVITQKLRFTQASAKYGIPKGTLYDNILGKSKRMLVLDQVGLTEAQELSVLEFCCEISSMPYNRRTSKSLSDIIKFIAKIKQDEKKDDFQISMRQGFKWWWAFTKKHNIISLYYQEGEQESNKMQIKSCTKTKEDQHRRVSSPDNLLNLINSPTSIPINIPTSSFLPFLGLNNHSKYSLQHPDFMIPTNSAATNII